MAVLNNSALVGAAGKGGGGAVAQRSLRFNSADSSHLSKTFASAGNRKTFTLSLWLKRARLGTNVVTIFGAGQSGGYGDKIVFTSSDTLRFFANGGNNGDITTTQVFRDVSAWYHLVIAVDTTQATAANRIRLYLNGSEITALSATYPAQNYEFASLNTATAQEIGRGWGDTFDGYMASVHFIDGQALTPSSFAETDATTGQWIPKLYTGSYGTNGFKLNFSDNSSNTATTLGKDTSGNGNNWTPNNLSVTAGAGNDSLVDTPTSYGTDTGAGGSVRGNYATINPLSKAANVSLSNGNLDATNTVSGSAGCASTIGVSSGKWYCEVTVNAVGSETKIGICKENAIQSEAGSVANSWAYGNSGEKFNSNVNTSYGSSFTTGDVIGIAFDADAGSLFFYKNGTVQNSGTAAYTSLTSGPYFFQFTARATGSANNLSVNFGQRPFAYTAPSGFKALVDTNLTAPVIAKPNEVMDVKLYTGTGSAQTISGLGFSPDLVWVKQRNGAQNNILCDVVRGANNYLVSDLTQAENTSTTITAFNSDGFSVGGGGAVGGSGSTYVGWAWDAGTSTVTNTAGSITSQVRASTSSGFSVVTWTANNGAATIGHGLGVAPEFIIVKDRDTSTFWQVYHKSMGNTNAMSLNSTNAASAGSGNWNNTSPTSTVFSVGVSSNYLTDKHVAYCFAPVAGYSAMGSYTGNGSADGPFVWCGFRPRYLLIKHSSSGSDPWIVRDTARDPYNSGTSAKLAPNYSYEENNSTYLGFDYQTLVDFTSNGFKVRSTGNFSNASGETYIYAAFAESPFAYARAR